MGAGGGRRVFLLGEGPGGNLARIMTATKS